MRLPLLLAAVVAVPAAIASLTVAQAQYPRPQPSQPAPAAQPAPVAAPASAAAPAPAAAPEPAAAAAPLAAAASTTAPGYPPPTCTAPDYPGKAGSNAQILAFNTNFKTYGDCIRKYVDDARATSNAAIEAGNKAAVEYNKYADDVRNQIAADKAK